MELTRFAGWFFVFGLALIGIRDMARGDLSHSERIFWQGAAELAGAFIAAGMLHLIFAKLNDLIWWNRLEKNGPKTTDYRRLRLAVEKVMDGDNRIYFVNWKQAAMILDRLLKQENREIKTAAQAVLFEAYCDTEPAAPANA